MQKLMKKKLITKKQRGQIIIMMMFAMIPIILLMATIFNGGYLVAQKTRLQNATDTSVLMEASWTARSLNIMSMNNTALAQSQAITSAGWALEKPLMDAGLNAGLLAGLYIGRTVAIARLYPPVTTIIAPLMYLAAYVHLNNKVLDPLYDLQKEVKRAMHTSEDTGFAKAATSFGRMNRILKDKFPNSIEEYSTELMALNYSDASSVVRYTAWATDESKTHELDIPVIEQSFGDALGSLRDAFTDGDSLMPTLDSNTDSGLRDALASVKDVRDVYHAGLHGTQTNPFEISPTEFMAGDPMALVPSLNYFGNFRAQGYPDGTGPFTAARPQIADDFEKVYDEFESMRNGTFLGDMIAGLVRDAVPCPGPGFICNRIYNAIASIINAIFGPFLGSPYARQETDREDLDNRLTEVYEWSTYYGESHYSNSWDLSGSRSILGKDISAPPRMWRGILPGIYHGYDLRTLVSSGPLQDPSQLVENVQNDYKQQCFEDTIEAEKTLERQRKRAAKRDHWDNAQTDPAIPRPRHPDGSFMSRDEYSILTTGERDAADAIATATINAECQAEAERETPDLPDIDTTAEPGPTPSPTGSEPDFDNDDGVGQSHTNFSNLHGDNNTANAKKQGGGWQDPQTVQKYLTMINWFFEPAYQAIDLPFPLDAVLLAFVGDALVGAGRHETDPNLWCGAPFGEGFVCTNETPMYAVYQQRITPQFVSDFAGDAAAEFGFDMNDIPDTIRSNYMADRHDWSLVVSATAPLDLLIGGNSFGQVPTEMSTMAQAEVYNSQWFDLFTQTWKAKLTPISLLHDTEHYQRLTSVWRNELGYRIGDEILKPASLDGERIMNH